MTETTFTDLVSEVTTFVATYDVLIWGGAVVGLIAWGARRLLKMGR